MRPIVLDFESYFDRKSGYSLSAPGVTQESYTRDPRFAAHGAAVKWTPTTSAVWYDEKELRWQLAQEDWSDVFLICHHAQFDGFILNHHYGIRPAMWGCTLSMARQLLGNHVSASLDSVRAHFGIPAKRTPYNLFEGKRWHEMTPQVQGLVGEGACDEVESIWRIFNEFAKTFPAEEYVVVDTTIRMFTEPCLQGDTAVFGKVWQDEVVKKAQRLERLGVTAQQLGSPEAFAEILRSYGIEPDKKEGKKGENYAFAKTDPFMEELLVDEDEDIRALAEARLGIKSTLLQTRAETMGWMASRGSLCCYLSYCAAHTSRWGGGDGSNFQNWTNGSEINSAVIAPDGYLIAEPDASQIECRLLNFCAGQWDKVDEFRQGKDPYCGVATYFFGEQVYNPKEGDPRYDEMYLMRQLGKIVELQAGYGSGGPKIAHTVRIKSKGKIVLAPDEGMRARDAYRSTHPAISEHGTGYWAQATMCLKRMLNFVSYDWGPFCIRCDSERGTRRIGLPNGIELIYDTLEEHYDEETNETYFRIKQRKGWSKTYGAKLVENCLNSTAKVLTQRGWTPIVQVALSDLLWDGVEWVSHGGLVEKGRQSTNALNGVRMTAEHEVLSQNGWVRAAQAQGLHRAPVQLPGSYQRRGFDWEEAALVVPMRLRERDNDSRFGIYGARTPELRMQEKRPDCGSQKDPRPFRTSAVRGMGLDAGALPPTFASCLRSIRRAGYLRLQALENQLSEFLGRYVSDLPIWTNVGTQEQQSRLQSDELYVGFSPAAGTQHAKQPNHQDTVGQNGGKCGSEKSGDFGYDAILPHEQQLASGEVVCETGFYEPVFDIMNCGPRHRFVVLGDDGPFIVHNCIQALARVVISQAMIRLKRLGYRIVMTKHDSLWLLIPKDGRLDEHKQIILGEMSRELPWLPGCPLAAEFKTIGERYA